MEKVNKIALSATFGTDLGIVCKEKKNNEYND